MMQPEKHDDHRERRERQRGLVVETEERARLAPGQGSTGDEGDAEHEGAGDQQPRLQRFAFGDGRQLPREGGGLLGLEGTLL